MSKNDEGEGIGGARLLKELGMLPAPEVTRRHRAILDRKARRAATPDVPSIQTQSHYRAAPRIVLVLDKSSLCHRP